MSDLVYVYGAGSVGVYGDRCETDLCRDVYVTRHRAAKRYASRQWHVVDGNCKEIMKEMATAQLRNKIN